ncbi:SIR2 family NAD-dependent protein deacylase [Melissospora conviva]|uniref:SIR2 family NAD-dependent protein deacylase n=1 Tax=Melissospora conviva TaxID=3388432 RepID=UPI003C27C62D
MSEQQPGPAGAVPAPLSLLAVLTGAGISTDSGIPDYRGPNGVWRRDPEAEKLVTYSYYLDDPQIRRRSWQMRRESRLLSAVPGPGHRALVALARAGLPLRVITQNVDGLHQAAGLTDDDVLELHGTARKVQCIRCKARSEMSEALHRVAGGEADPACRTCGGILKSATVMFGETLDPAVLNSARSTVLASDLILAVGTSLQVHPAAGLVDLAVATGARLIIVNAEPTPYDDLATEIIREPIAESLPRLVGRIAAGAGLTLG